LAIRFPIANNFRGVSHDGEWAEFSEILRAYPLKVLQSQKRGGPTLVLFERSRLRTRSPIFLGQFKGLSPFKLQKAMFGVQGQKGGVCSLKNTNLFALLKTNIILLSMTFF
jgi:hypothetical protein